MFRSEGVRRAARASAPLGAILLAALIPKCPLCVAAALSALGMGAMLGAHFAPGVRALAIALALVSSLAFARSEWLRHRRRVCCGR
jgi:hypothetical protein